MLPFVGVDGEGGDIPDEYGFVSHHYTMLRAGNRYVTPPEGDPSGTSVAEHCLGFLTSLERRKIYVSYFFDYDVTMMLRGLPERELRALIAGQEIYHGDFRISYRPRKELIVKRWGRRVTINDVGTFFQTRFVRALEQWNIGTVEQRELIGEGKEQRATFGHLTAETVEYNRLECELLVDLMEKFRRTCEIIGYVPARWQGPGQLAKAMFRKHGIPKTADLPEPPPGVWEIAQAAYYGGRFETSAVGPVRGPVDGWDINSAYPHACTLLPCLLHGQWRPSRDVHPNGIYSITFRHPNGQPWHGLPVRTRDGAIRFPRDGSGWYWGEEILSAVALGCTFTVHHGWRYHQECQHQPFAFNHRLYSIRKGLGKTEAGMAIKLGTNSEYGVIAQSVGNPPYANPIWAGRITSITRSRLNHAISYDPSAVFMLATDGLFCRSGALPLLSSDELGGWDRTVYPSGMHIIQPGVYFVGHKSTCEPDDDCKCAPKTRGVPQTAIIKHEEELKNAWDGTADAGMPVVLRSFNGLRLSLHRNAMHAAGQWVPVEKRISYDWSTKRRPHTLTATAEASRTAPYDGDTGLWTVPYDRLIGGNLTRDMDRLQFADTPDWAELLTEEL